MGKEQIIEQIKKYNRSAHLDFLSSFDEQSLLSYLERLLLANGPRGRDSVWVRPMGFPPNLAHPTPQ